MKQITKIIKTLGKLNVQNMTSNNGNSVPNQFIIRTNEGVIFQSYNSIIVIEPNEGNTILNRHMWDYSTTTGKYRNQFLGENKAETQAKIDSGEYTLADI